MPVASLRPSEIIEVISYDFFLTAFGFSLAAGIVRAQSSNSSMWLGLSISAGLLLLLSLFFWRLSSSIEKRVSNLID